MQVKGLSIEELGARNDLVLALPDRIQAIPDGTPTSKKNGGWTSGWTSSATRQEIKFDSGLFNHIGTTFWKLSLILLVLRLKLENLYGIRITYCILFPVDVRWKI